MKAVLVFLLFVCAVSAQTKFSSKSGKKSQSKNSDVDVSERESDYHFSWLHTPRRTKYSWRGAKRYCTKLGDDWAPISINDDGENEFVSKALIKDDQDYIWTGGRRSGGDWKWPRGPFRFVGWSHTGRKKIPQPDNRGGNENCLAVLNDFYHDGVKWHDVGCHHTKPVICERPVKH